MAGVLANRPCKDSLAATLHTRGRFGWSGKVRAMPKAAGRLVLAGLHNGHCCRCCQPGPEERVV